MTAHRPREEETTHSVLALFKLAPAFPVFPLAGTTTLAGVQLFKASTASAAINPVASSPSYPSPFVPAFSISSTSISPYPASKANFAPYSFCAANWIEKDSRSLVRLRTSSEASRCASSVRRAARSLLSLVMCAWSSLLGFECDDWNEVSLLARVVVRAFFAMRSFSKLRCEGYST